MTDQVRQKYKLISDQLLQWMEKEGFRGWDPQDGLNSPLLKGLSKFHRSLGVAGLQLVQRSPVNLRPFLGIPKTMNAKGMGLILAALVRRYRIWEDQEDLNRAAWIGQWLEENISKGYSGACWGYPFDWANRTFYAPKGMPTIVNTVFIGYALLDFYAVTGEMRWLSLARSSCEFICHDLNRTSGEKGFCFSYTPIDGSQIHNANLLGASLLARIGKIIDNAGYIQMALESAFFSIDAQHPDGSWPYGTAPQQKWVDSFHTGYNLLALKQISEVIRNKSIKAALDQGYDYYLSHFFLPDGTIKYFDHKTGPLDTHSFAHAVFCLTEMFMHPRTPLDLVDKVLAKMIKGFWNGNGYFYWRKKYGLTYRLPCMRWVQAWAFLALSNYCLQFRRCEKGR